MSFSSRMEHDVPARKLKEEDVEVEAGLS
jgi:hypothetical protein